jgi:hypothetical protein
VAAAEKANVRLTMDPNDQPVTADDGVGAQDSMGGLCFDLLASQANEAAELLFLALARGSRWQSPLRP